MKTRTDAHRPSVIKPDEYVFVACDYQGSGLEVMGFIEERKAFRAHMERTGGKFAERFNGGDCHICGARAAYLARFHHEPSNTYITTGMDCAEKMDMGDLILFKSFRKRVAAGLKTTRGKLKAYRLLEERGLQAAWEAFEKNEKLALEKGYGALPRSEQILLDIVRSVVKYGNISDAQADYVRNLLTHISMRPQIEAKRAAEIKAAAPVPQTTERIKIVGVILSTKEQQSIYGNVTKMLVRHETGYKLWGTMPSGLSADKGDIVEFTARVERSPNDAKFGFFSRPAKASVITTATVTA